MYPTVEVRWFYKGQIPDSVLTAYKKKTPAPEEPSERTDYYLQLPDNHRVGIKMREGMIEIKHRVQQYGTVHFHDRVTGEVEGWEKWSFGLAQASEQLEKVPSKGWTGVRKQRRLQRYQFTDDHKVLAVKAGEECKQGCEWELSNLHIEDKKEQWWSMAFEAFGEGTDLKDILVSIVKKVMSAQREWDYLFSDSYGYPVWLAFIQKK